MIIEALAWFVLILFFNGFISVFIADPIKQVSFVEAMTSVILIEVIIIVLFGAVFLFGWAVEYLFFNEELTK